MYRMLWVSDHLPNHGIHDVPNATRLMNQMELDGWTLMSIAPGTKNGVTDNGIYLTFRRNE